MISILKLAQGFKDLPSKNSHNQGDILGKNMSARAKLKETLPVVPNTTIQCSARLDRVVPRSSNEESIILNEVKVGCDSSADKPLITGTQEAGRRTQLPEGSDPSQLPVEAQLPVEGHRIRSLRIHEMICESKSQNLFYKFGEIWGISQILPNL